MLSTRLRKRIAAEQVEAWREKRYRAFRLWQRESVLPELNLWWRRNKYRVLATIDERIFYWKNEANEYWVDFQVTSENQESEGKRKS